MDNDVTASQTCCLSGYCVHHCGEALRVSDNFADFYTDMHFTEEEDFQRIFEDLADFYSEIHLCLKEAGKKPHSNMRQNCTKTAYKVKKWGMQT